MCMNQIEDCKTMSDLEELFDEKFPTYRKETERIGRRLQKMEDDIRTVFPEAFFGNIDGFGLFLFHYDNVNLILSDRRGFLNGDEKIVNTIYHGEGGGY